ncbi:MAG TPA: cytochrome c [Acidobacteriaceae bacterium]|nr:cytochrome c [Acidobacteriaceae bacterium]
MKKFLLGFIIALLLVPVAVWAYISFGNPPVAVADPPFPFERQIARSPLHARIDREMPRTAPIDATETNLEAGAHIYRQDCAACHGLPGRHSDFAAYMYPDAPQLWKQHRQGVVGVSDDPPGETYWKVDNGIRLSGMPAFNKILTQTQMWQVTLLLADAEKPMPASVQGVLQPPLAPDAPAASSPPGAARPKAK